MYIRIDRLRYFSSTRVRFHSNRAERYPYNDLVETHPMDVPRLLRIARKTIGFFRNNTRDEETPSPLRSILHIYILFKKHVGYYRNRIDAFQSADIRTVGWNGNSKSEHVVPAARDREGWGKKTFSNRSDYFQIANTGEEEEEEEGERWERGKANPSARGVNRDKRRIVLRIQSVTIQAAYGEGEGMTWQYEERTHWLKQAYLRTKQIPRQIGRFSLRAAVQSFLTRHVRAAFAN